MSTIIHLRFTRCDRKANIYYLRSDLLPSDARIPSNDDGVKSREFVYWQTMLNNEVGFEANVNRDINACYLLIVRHMWIAFPPSKSCMFNEV